MRRWADTTRIAEAQSLRISITTQRVGNVVEKTRDVLYMSRDACPALEIAELAEDHTEAFGE